MHSARLEAKAALSLARNPSPGGMGRRLPRAASEGFLERATRRPSALHPRPAASGRGRAGLDRALDASLSHSAFLVALSLATTIYGQGRPVSDRAVSYPVNARRLSGAELWRVISTGLSRDHSPGEPAEEGN